MPLRNDAQVAVWKQQYLSIGYDRPDVVADLDRRLTAHGKRHEFHTYANAQHAFFNDTRESYDAKAAADAWNRTLAFLRRELA